MRGMIRYAYIEMKRRYGLIVFGIAAVIGIVIVYTAGKFGETTMKIDMGGEQTNRMAALTHPMELSIATYMAFLVFVSVLITSGFIPRLFEKGRVDYMLSKPVSRVMVYWYRLCAVWIIYSLMIIGTGLVSYTVGAALFKTFNPSIFVLFAGPILTLFLWLTVTGFIGIVNGSQGLAIMVAFVIWTAQGILEQHEAIVAALTGMGYEFVGYLVTGLYYILPKTSQLTDLANGLALGMEIESWVPLWSTMLFALVMLIGAAMLFQRKDY